MWSFVTTYVIFRWYKSSYTSVPGSLFLSPVAGDLNTLLASRVTVSFPRAPPGTSAVSKLNHWVLVVYFIVAIPPGRLNLP